MSVVYRATDRLTGDLVALKLLRDVDGLDPERFVREALVLAELSHPAIVRYIATAPSTGGPTSSWSGSSAKTSTSGSSVRASR